MTQIVFPVSYTHLKTIHETVELIRSLPGEKLGDLIKMPLNHCFVTGRQGIEKNLKIVGFFIHDSNGVGFQITVEHDKMTGIFQGIKNFYSLASVSYTHLDVYKRQMLRIPVSMHNVPEKDIYRPAAWNAFGMEKEGADFRACKNYGPLYK